MESWSSIRSGFTPQTIWSWRATFTSLVIARMVVEGLNLLTFLAVAPLLVSGRIAAA